MIPRSRRRRSFALAVTAAISLSLCSTVVIAQGGGGRGGPVRPSFNISDNPLLEAFRFRNVGPASMGGRLDDIAVSVSNPNVIYLGYATSSVWKSVDNAVSWKPIFNSGTTASIGALAVDPTNENVLYVGTGEANNRQTNSFGDGVYKTTDGGTTWTHLGLTETQSIGRIVIDPRNTQVVYVAAEGHLFGPNPERGIYKTTDGGKTWTLSKFIDENTGFSDITMDPSNSNILYAASYQRRRTACCFNGGGPGSGLWKTEDAGKTWKKFTNFGIPDSLTVGRVAVAVAASSPNVVYAQMEVGVSGTPAPAGRGGRGGGGGGGGGGANACNAQVPPNAFPPNSGDVSILQGAQGNAAGGRGAGGGGAGGRGGRGGRGAAAPAAGAAAAPAAPAGPDVARSGVWRSDDKGKTWKKVSDCDGRPMYFSQVRVDPTNPAIVYLSDLPVEKSVDSGKTFFQLTKPGTGSMTGGHVDQHARWIDPKNPNHILIGNDGGLSVSWNQGLTWEFVNTMSTGLAYIVTADMRRPYWLYIGLQDNDSWGGPSSTRADSIYNNDWFDICGGDGFYTAVNQDKPWVIYCESEDANPSTRYDLKTGTSRSIVPSAGGGGRGGGGGGGGGGGRGAGGRGNVLNAQPGDVYRFNWNTPFILSPNDQNILWFGGNRLFKSYDGGDTYVASADLTKAIDRTKVTVMGVTGDKTMLSKNDGLTAYGTIISISESPVLPGVVWAGTDDGNLNVSRDGGMTFTEVSKNLPNLKQVDLANQYWISRIDASHFEAGRAYVAVDGHRSDDLHPHVYVTNDYGKTFTDITNNLPAFGNVQVIREDPKNPNLLFVGTEFGLFTSLDAGKTWERFMNDYPTVRTDDILIHPRDGDLIVATHGQSVFIADDITPLEQLTPAVQASDAYLFDIRPGVAYIRDVSKGQHTAGDRGWSAPNAPAGTAISYYLKAPASGSPVLTVTNACGTTTTLPATNRAGINRVQFPSAGGGRGAGGGGGAFGPPPGDTSAADSAAAAIAAGRGGGAGGAGRGAGGGQACGAAGGGRGGRGGGGAAAGVYTAKLTVNGKEYSKTFEILEDKSAWDPWAIDK